MYQLEKADWIDFPISVRIAKDGFYDMTGHPEYVLAVIADQRTITGEHLWNFIRMFLLPLSIRGWFGARLVIYCIFRNAAFWLKWTPSILTSLLRKSYGSKRPKASPDQP